jgi:hypothetical protein
VHVVPLPLSKNGSGLFGEPLAFQPRLDQRGNLGMFLSIIIMCELPEMPALRQASLLECVT